jgi:hypothetical protein
MNFLLKILFFIKKISIEVDTIEKLRFWRSFYTRIEEICSKDEVL